MEKEINRATYFEIKHKYLFFRSLLLIIRILSIILFVLLVIFISAVSNMEEKTESFMNFYNTLSNISRIAIPVFILIWIGIKIIVVMFVRRLRPMKYKLEIVDEI